VLRRFEITKAALGVTAHGLRHQHANDRYEELSGEPSPVRGGAGAGDADGAARMAVSSELGHGRIEITDAYLGQSAVMRSKGRNAPPPKEPGDPVCA
jgi:integrase